MSLQISKGRSLVSKQKLAGVFLAIFALFIQPLVALNLPSAFANSANIDNVVFSPATTTINASAGKTFTLKFRQGTADEALDSSATVELTTTSATGEFADGSSVANPWSHTATYSTNSSSASKTFRYKDSSAGSHTLTARVSGGGLTSPLDATATVTVDAPIAPAPTLSLDTYFVKNIYRGIATDVKVNNLTDANSVKVEVSRTGGGSIVKTAKTSVLNTLNSGSSAAVTAPIVIQGGTYSEVNSNSWNMPVGNPWTSATTPELVTVTITRTGGPDLVMSKAISASMGSFATLSEVMPAPVVCTYDFTAEKMWEVTWGYGFEDRNGGTPIFTKQSNGGLVTLNGDPVPAYMASPSWHWLYVVEGQNRHYDYGFADGTTRTADVTFSDVNGCQTPAIVWNVIPPDTNGPTVAVHSSSPDNNDYLSGVRYTREDQPDQQRNRFIFNVTDPSGVKKVAMYVTNHATGVKVKEYALTQHGTQTDQWYADVDTTQFSNGVYDIAARAVDNENNATYFNNRRTSYRVTIDNTAPTITVKSAPDTTGSIAAGVFSKVSFKLHDNTKFEGKYTINGVDSVIGSSNWGDANFIKVGQRGAVYGENTITLRDLAGNSTSYTFTLDNVVPTITVKDGFVGDKDAAIFSNVSFSLFDAHKVDKYTINGNESDFGNNKWSDANFQNIKPHLVQGTNTFIFYDVAGNSKTFEFTYDTVAPTATYFSFSNSSGGQNGNVTTKDDVTVTMTTSEPVQIPNDWTRVDDTHFTRVYDSNGKYETVLTDFAGNVSTPQKFEVKRIDKTLPAFNIADGAVIGSSEVEIVITEDNISKVFVDTVDTAFAGSKPYYVVVVGEGVHTVRAIDKAGNEKTISFTIDLHSPTASLTSNKSGVTKGPVAVARTANDNLALKKYTYCVTLNGATTCEDGTGTLAASTKTYTQDGVYSATLQAWDEAGNTSGEKSVSFTIDTQMPSAPAILVAGSTGVSGMGEAGSTITVYVDGVIAGTATVGSNGTWSYTFSPALSTTSPHSITAVAADAAGNVSDSSSEVTLLAIAGRSAILSRGTPDRITLPNSFIATQVSPQASPATITIADDEEDEGEVLGTETKSTPLEQTAALSPSTEGWKVWGVAWYWYLLGAALVAGSWWFIAGRRRRRAQEEF